ncbi:hypothetical protein LY76DRAFT_665137 [Colletotrichum caudatum]|nr:hypothetical protein LY76DRAFT_665137 [Colletotrichum caudatum]
MQAECLSFDSASVTIKDESSGHVERVDLPMRALAGGYYANVMRMYDHLGIPYHPIRFLFSFVKALPARKPDAAAAAAAAAGGGATGEYFVHASNLHRIPPWPGSRGVLVHLIEVLYLIVCQFWFTVACLLVRPATDDDDEAETLDEYLRRVWLPRRYVTHYLLPLLSAVSTCSHDELLAFPASDVVDYKRLSQGRQHYTVCGGVHQVEGRLAREMRDVRLGVCVAQVAPTADGRVRVRWQRTGGGGGGGGGVEPAREDVFDRVVLAVSPDVAGKVFAPLRQTLGAIPTTRVESSVLRPALHSAAAAAASGHHHQAFTVVDDDDESGLPRACSHHRGTAIPPQLICLRTDFAAGGGGQTEALHTMPGGAVVVTCPLDPGRADAKRVLRTARFTRTLRTAESRAVVRRIMGESGGPDKKTDAAAGAAPPPAWVNGQDNVWLAGAWCWDGMVLLEGCLVSAMRVADDFGVNVPWRAGVARAG